MTRRGNGKSEMALLGGKNKKVMGRNEILQLFICKNQDLKIIELP